MYVTKHPVVKRIEPEVAASLRDFGYELVQIKYGGLARRRQLTVYIDKPGGVTSDDCAQMAQRLSLLLDTLEAPEDTWTLIVSSPGVERPLTKDEDFVRFTGQMAAVTIHPPGGRKTTRTGVIREVADDQVRLTCDDQSYDIPVADIIAAHLVYDWGKEEYDQ